MRKLPVMFLLLVMSVPALAQSVEFKTGTVAIGDPVERLIKIAGKPERIEPFPGMPEFQRHEYFADGRNVTVTVKDGKVTGIGVLDFSSK